MKKVNIAEHEAALASHKELVATKTATFADVKTALSFAEAEHERHEAGNAAASTRLRKWLEVAKQIAQVVKVAVLVKDVLTEGK